MALQGGGREGGGVGALCAEYQQFTKELLFLLKICQQQEKVKRDQGERERTLNYHDMALGVYKLIEGAAFWGGSATVYV